MTSKLKLIFKEYKFWILSTFVVSMLFLLFMQMDLLETSYQGYIMSQGNVFNFYEATKGAAYLPSTFILFAIWNVPTLLVSILSGIDVESLGFIGTRIFLYWNKLLPVIFYLGCTYYVYRISFEITKQKKLAQIVSFAFFTAPIAIYSQFIFGQYDSFMVFFCLGGMYYFFKRDMLKFTIFFAISITFKYTAVVIYIPLLLMREKKVLQIIKDLCILVIPVVLELVLFKNTGSASGFVSSKMDYIFGMSLSNSYFSIQIVVLLFVLLCAFSYFNEKPSLETDANWAFFYCNFAVFLLFGLSAWHPQWLLLAVPFWVISTYINKNTEMFLLIDAIMMLFFVLYVVQNWRGIADQELLRLGVLGPLLEHHGSYKSISDFIPSIFTKDTCITILSSLMLVQVIFKHPKYANTLKSKIDVDIPKLFLFSISGLAMFLLPCAISVRSLLNSDKTPVNTGKEYVSIKSRIDENYNLNQLKRLSYDASHLEVLPFSYSGEVINLKESFLNISDKASKIIIPLSTENVVKQLLVVTDSYGEEIYKGDVDSKDGELIYDIRDVNLKKGEVYNLEFQTRENYGYLYKTSYCVRNDLSQVLVNGQSQNFDIVFKIIE